MGKAGDWRGSRGNFAGEKRNAPAHVARSMPVFA
jgi:hypothetical protein